MTVDRAADLAAAVVEAPESAGTILEEAGVSRSQLDSLIYDIAADPAKRTRFLERVRAVLSSR